MRPRSRAWGYKFWASVQNGLSYGVSYAAYALRFPNPSICNLILKSSVYLKISNWSIGILQKEFGICTTLGQSVYRQLELVLKDPSTGNLQYSYRCTLA